MSVAASRWALSYLDSQPLPRDGGLSADARATLLALAAHAGYPPRGVGPHIANPSAATLGRILGRNERTVRGYLDEIEARSVLPVKRRPGCTPAWHFVVAGMSTTPGVSDPGSDIPNPGRFRRDPGRARPTKGEGDVHTSTDAVPRGAPVTVSVSHDHVSPGAGWDDYYAPERMNGAAAHVR